MNKLILVWLLSGVGLVWADYLPRVGPNPIRVRSVRTVPPVELEVPPAVLRLQEENSVVPPVAEPTEPEAPVPEKAQPLASTPDVPSVPPPVLLEVAPSSERPKVSWVPPATVDPPPRTAESIALGAMLPYFKNRPGKAGGSKGVVLPVNFSPPVPVPSPSSKASYISR